MQKTTVEKNGAVRRITTREASIKTAAVEVKALTISGKQVTLSVFRQLQNEDLIDPLSGQLKGVPWGCINYYWGGCAVANHLHVVWQKGTELRRACVFESFGMRGRFLGRHTIKKEGIPLLDRAVEMEVLRLLREVRSGEFSADLIFSRGFQCLGCDHSLSDFYKPDDEGWRLLSDYKEARWNTKKTADLHEKTQKYLDLHDYSPEEYSEFEDLVSQFNGQWRESYTAVEATEQLFIAV